MNALAKLRKKPAKDRSKVVIDSNKTTSRLKKLIVVLVVILFATLGATLGYNKWKERDLTAKANSWGYPFYVDDVKVATCRFATGGMWRVKLVAVKRHGTYRGITVGANSEAIAPVQKDWYGDYVSGNETNRLIGGGNTEYSIIVYSYKDKAHWAANVASPNPSYRTLTLAMTRDC